MHMCNTETSKGSYSYTGVNMPGQSLGIMGRPRGHHGHHDLLDHLPSVIL